MIELLCITLLLVLFAVAFSLYGSHVHCQVNIGIAICVAAKQLNIDRGAAVIRPNIFITFY